MWDTLEVIYGVPPKMEQDGMNTRGEEVETPNECEICFHIWCSTLRNFGTYVITVVINKYLRIKNRNQKPGQILKSRDRMFMIFQKNSKKE